MDSISLNMGSERSNPDGGHVPTDGMLYMCCAELARLDLMRAHAIKDARGSCADRVCEIDLAIAYVNQIMDSMK